MASAIHPTALKPGKEADFVVLDYKATPLIDHRLSQTTTLEESSSR